MYNKSGKTVKNETDFRRNVDPSVRRKNNQQLIELKALQKEFRDRQKESDKYEQALEVEKAQLENGTKLLEDAQNRLAEAQIPIDADYLPEGAQPRARIQARDAVKLEVDQLEAALQAQKTATHKVAEASINAKKRLFNVEKDLNRFAEGVDDVILAKQTIDELDKQKREQVKKIEARAAANKEKQEREAKAAKEAQQLELERIEKKREAAARHLQKFSRNKMAKSHAYTHEMTQQIKAAHEGQHADRTEAVLELKENTRAVNLQLAGRAEKYRNKVADSKKRLEDQKEELLSKGLNPYVEFRRQEINREDEAREKRLREEVNRNKKELADKLHREDAVLRSQEEAKLRSKKYADEHRAAQGRQVVEDRNERYIISRTSAHTEVLDPSGKALRVDPSQITDIADYSFGLGKSSRIPAVNIRRITQQIREELKADQNDLGEYSRLLTGLVKRSNSLGAGDAEEFPDVFGDDDDDDGGVGRATSAPQPMDDDSSLQLLQGQNVVNVRDLSQFEALATQAGAMPGADIAAVTLNMKGSTAEKQHLVDLAVEEEGSLDAADTLQSLTSPKYTITQLSKFERDSLDRAKDRHRERIEDGVPQIAGGRAFSGDSFASKPALLLFKDFEVGNVYKKKFILTNVSYTFNSFKLLDLPDDVIDFFTITYTKPGRMSAGMSCNLDIAFSPQINKDIFTELTLQTQTGPVRIPIQCLIKRCAPRITSPHINFGNLIIGEKTTIPLKIINTQALSTKFTIYPLYQEARKVKTAMFGGVHGAGESSAGELDSGIGAAIDSLGDGTAFDSENVDGIEEEKEYGNEKSLPNAAAAAEVRQHDTADNILPEDDMHDIEILEAEEGAGGEYAGTEPAINNAELNTRVRRVITKVVRKKKREHPHPLSCMQLEGLLEGYSEVCIDVLCAPLTLGNIEQKFVVVFDGVDEAAGTVDDLGEYVTKEQIVSATAFGDEVAIYVAEQDLDFRCTLFDRIYRGKVLVKNRAKSAYRVMVKVAPAFSQFVEANPTVFFVQAKSSQSINIKFAPMREILNGLSAHFTLPSEDYQHAVTTSMPIEIQAVNQEISAYFVLHSIVCQSTVEISTPVIEFGKIFVGQRSTRPVTLRNTSMLPQKIAFVRLRKEFTVQPNDGFAVLLPNEVMDFEVSFGPNSAINYELDLTVLTSFNDSYNIKVIAEGIDPPLALSNSVINMRTTPAGEKVVESTIIRNQTRHKQRFQIMQPPTIFSWISISPSVVELEPHSSCRLEIEFSPPDNIRDLDPEQWHQQTLESVTASTKALNDEVSGGDEAMGPATNDNQLISPFEQWTTDAGWVYGKGMFGEIQWVKASSAGLKEGESNAENSQIGNSASVEGGDEKSSVDVEEPAVAPPSVIMEETEAQVEEGNEDVSTDEKSLAFDELPEEEWGIVGRWNFPILVRPRKKASDTGSKLNKSEPVPLFLSLQTAVTLPQIDSDTKILDFGQISVGTRKLLSFKVFNRGNESVRLKSIGLNAVGPFAMIRPAKSIRSNEGRVIVVECLPTQAGLFVEVLEISAADPEVGGHRIHLTLRVQGLKPVVSLNGLSAPPPNWNPRSGILDFGNTVMRDYVVKQFSIKNQSTFAINAKIKRITGEKAAPSRQASLVERTGTGAPIFSIRPEDVVIEEGSEQVIEVTFRPDRGRFHPFREDIDVLIGNTDEILRVGLLGRCWDRQLIVLPADPRDEPFSKKAFQGIDAAASVEDVHGSHISSSLRSLAETARSTWNLFKTSDPDITLIFPDPFAPDAPSDSYTEVGAEGGDGANSKKGKGKSDAASADSIGARKQVKRLKLCSNLIGDSRVGSTVAGSFEVVLSEDAIASKLFSLSTDKGTINPGSEVSLDITCTLPKPRSLGGIFVGSWQSFSVDIVLKGGWYRSGEAEEKRVVVQMKAYVSL